MDLLKKLDDMEKIPTISEFLKSKGCGFEKQFEKEFYYDVEIDDIRKLIKLHVEAALKSVETKVTDSLSIFKENDMCKTYYPLENIK